MRIAEVSAYVAQAYATLALVDVLRRTDQNSSTPQKGLSAWVKEIPGA